MDNLVPFADKDQKLSINHIEELKTEQDQLYNEFQMEVAKEYKSGIGDPTRLVGKQELKRGAVRKHIASIKRKFRH